MYSDIFSAVYDQFGWNYYPESFAELLWQWILQEKRDIKSMLDIGCGTGILAALMKEKGIDACGMDLSEGMIRMAKEHYPDMHFEVGDMITYRPKRQFALITATCDVINHILTAEDVRKVFANVYAYTADGGIFLFDLLKEEEARPCESIELGEIDGESVSFRIIREDKYVTLQIDIRSRDGLCHTEKIAERIYDPLQIASFLREAGFSSVTVTDQLMTGSGEHAATWFVIAEK